MRRAAAQADVQPALGLDPRRRDMEEGGRPRNGVLFRLETRLSAPVDREGLQAESGVQQDEVQRRIGSRLASARDKSARTIGFRLWGAERRG